jgi:hypothetical protein
MSLSFMDLHELHGGAEPKHSSRLGRHGEVRPLELPSDQSPLRIQETRCERFSR